jgi:hypothetical protein
MGLLAATTPLPPQPSPPPRSASPATPAPAIDRAAEKAKIEALIEAIRSLAGAKFVRNGAEYDRDAAADHLTMKWNAASDRITTARQFIDQIGSKSSSSGRAYAIRLNDGLEITCRQFLLDELAKIEAVPADARDSSGPQASPFSNPSDVGFNAAASDPKAIRLADLTMEAMGGREAWDGTRYLTWRHLGERRYLWDKQTGNMRIEFTTREANEPMLILMNMTTRAGRAWRAGGAVTAADDLAVILRDAHGTWVNDRSWMFMPYRLKEGGITLKYGDQRAMENGRVAGVIVVTIGEVDELPAHKVEVFIAKESGLVEQWALFEKADDPAPKFITPWKNWQRYGRIMLSDDRGDLNGRATKHTDLAVLESVPAGAFTSPEPIDWPALLRSGVSAADHSRERIVPRVRIARATAPYSASGFTSLSAASSTGSRPEKKSFDDSSTSTSGNIEGGSAGSVMNRLVEY